MENKKAGPKVIQLPTAEDKPKESVLTHALLSDGKWYEIVEGSLCLFKSSAAANSAPIAQFDTWIQEEYDAKLVKRTLQISLHTVAGWAMATENQLNES